MEKLKETLKDKKLWIFFIIVIAFFGIFIKMEYATDTYCVFTASTKSMAEHFLKSGRFVTALAEIVLAFLNIGNEMTYILSFLLAIICTVISVYKLYKIFEDEVPSKILLGIAVVMIIINTFSIELYLFLEKGILMLSVLLCVLAFENMVKFFKGSKKAIIFVLMYMLLANFSYQGTVALFVALSCLYIVKYSKNAKTFIANNIITAFCYGIPAIINYIIVRFVFVNGRVNAQYNIALSIRKIIDNTQEMLITTYKLMPQYMFLAIFCILVAIGFICAIKEKKKVLGKLAGGTYLVVATFITTIFPQIMQSTDSIGFAPRSTYAFASILGLIVLYILIHKKPSVMIQRILMVVLIFYLGVQYINFENISIDRYSLNYTDYYQFLQIQEIIDAYETETGKKITKVANYQDNSEGGYPQLFISHDINVKAMWPDWSRIDFLEYYFDRDFQEVEKSQEVYEQYFKEKNWRFFSKEQVVLIDETMHLFIY